MPCDSSYLRPRAEELESARVRELLREVNGQPFNHDEPAEVYGQVAKLDSDTAALCVWCKNHRSEIQDHSLELQIWWRDHQKRDAEREEEEASERKRNALLKQAKAKLTKEEWNAILDSK